MQPEDVGASDSGWIKDYGFKVSTNCCLAFALQ